MEALNIVFRIVVFLVGFAIIIETIISVVKTVVLPRSAPDPLVRIVFLTIRVFLVIPLKRARNYMDYDHIMAYFSPIGLLALVPTWYTCVSIGYAGLYWASGSMSWFEAFKLSGSSLLTLGFIPPEQPHQVVLAFTEATLGLVLVALLISYLPTMYGAFSRREAAVTLLEVRAGSPPSAVEMLVRFHRIHGLHRLSEVWLNWEIWFADIGESHTSLPALVFFRSPRPDHSWVTAAGAVLDAAALTQSIIDIPHDVKGQLCIRAGYLALRNIADFYNTPYNPDPHFPEDPISVTRAEFDEACRTLEEQDVPLKPDREQAWLDFAGWRVNYDRVLLSLASLTIAPPAPWSSDRVQYSIIPPAILKMRRRRRLTSNE